MPLTSINPATGQRIGTYEEISEGEAAAAVDAAYEAWRDWRRTSFAERARLFAEAGRFLRRRKDELAALIAREMGKPLVQGQAEIEKCAVACDYFAENAEHHLARDVIERGDPQSYVAFEPLGVILAVMPWNFPFFQVFRFAAPALMAGNVAVLKHASNVSGCARAIVEIFEEAGFPANVFNWLPIGSGHVDALIAHRRVAAVTLTGSAKAGGEIAAAAGKALKKTVLELGGSDAYLVLEDADFDHAVATCVESRLLNSGQSCICAKRFVVVEPLLARFTEAFVAAMAAKHVGDPMAHGTDIGPLARGDLRDVLHDQVQRSIAKGAEALLGAVMPSGEGFFYPPTVLGSVGPGMPAYEEELFGPVAAIISARDEADAIRIGNDSRYGLGAAVFTRDLERGERVARELEAGTVAINGLVASDARRPFGGVKDSGHGRELGSYGLKEFVNIKTVVATR